MGRKRSFRYAMMKISVIKANGCYVKFKLSNPLNRCVVTNPKNFSDIRNNIRYIDMRNLKLVRCLH